MMTTDDDLQLLSQQIEATRADIEEVRSVGEMRNYRTLCDLRKSLSDLLLAKQRYLGEKESIEHDRWVREQHRAAFATGRLAPS